MYVDTLTLVLFLNLVEVGRSGFRRVSIGDKSVDYSFLSLMRTKV